MVTEALTYAALFAAALVLTAILTPLVREMNRTFGMVDRPDPRRVNKTPIPRGGGLALFLGVFVSYVALTQSAAFAQHCVVDHRYYILSAVIVALGYADDKFSLRPVVKLLGQVAVAVAAWAWADFSFRGVWPLLPAWLDAALSVFWILGAVNAFNLIDGLDGLASGLALIATAGMAGALALAGGHPALGFHFALMGGLLGFLCYNYNPASVFLGDAGSMFLGFILATLPVSSHAEGSFLVSVGVPLLAMGVPIFDTSIAIFRRTVRRLLNRGDSSGEVMTADADHLHHRLLRRMGLSQRKAVWSLYAFALLLVIVGLVAVSLQSRASGLWLLATTVVAVVVFKDLARIEFFDTGRLLDRLAHKRDVGFRRRIARLSVPLYVAFDVVALVAVFFLAAGTLDIPLTHRLVRVALPLVVISTFAMLVVFHVYRTIWARAVLSNFVRLLVACVLGSVIGTVAVYYAPQIVLPRFDAFAILYAALAFVALAAGRTVRQGVRDFFYALDCARLVGRKDVSRVLVYGAGLRYKAFRRDLVRTAAENDRIIVGILDDDLLLRGHYIGGIRVLGTLSQAPEIINRVNADAVVVACDIPDEWMKIVLETLRPTGVRVTRFTLNETEVVAGAASSHSLVGDRRGLV